MAVGCAEMERDKNPREKVRREAQSARETIETRKEEVPTAVDVLDLGARDRDASGGRHISSSAGGVTRSAGARTAEASPNGIPW